MKIGTHDGRFHSDETFSVATLLLVYPDAEVVRTRDEEVLATCDIRVDVGRKYDPATGDYDHHQALPPRANGIKYSSLGIIWNSFGVQACGGEEETKLHVEERFIQVIDARDNGQRLYGDSRRFGGVRPYDAADLIDEFNPGWDDLNLDYDSAFTQAVDLAKEALRNIIRRSRSAVKAKPFVVRAINLAEDPRIIVLERACPWKEVVDRFAPKALYVVFPDVDKWLVQCVPGSKGIKRHLPACWLTNDFATITGVPDAVFVHGGLYLCSARSKEGALALANLALEQQ